MKFDVPTREQVAPQNQEIFDNLNKGLGFVPNLYATFAYSDTALGNYLTFQNAKSSLKAKEREVVNLVVSQVNDCRYCQSAHTALGKMNGFTDEQILELRGGSASFDAKLDALVKLAKEITTSHGRPSDETISAFFAAGYDKGNLIDVILNVGDKIISNYLHGITNIPIDFPVAPELEAVEA
ncbi:MAG TPA: alkylhydroperoxidase [Cytophagales bacterium]|nr:alkylhydroperoxidase [Cytophagales bacterium]HAA23970.1 alkylhydroperoxidase [Cytophagales bacterium]HAP58366.1 alkylhydroperoxidase [Cytophagales bacterium]